MTNDELKGKLTISKTGCYIDHLGNYYSTVAGMCRCWGVRLDTFNSRMYKGWGLSKSLTHNNYKKVPDADPSVIWVFGEPFPSYEAIEAVYGYSKSQASKHKDDIEAWLLSRSTFYVDGKLFRTYTALSAEYGIGESTIRRRILLGWPLQDAVHTPVTHRLTW